MIWCMICAGKLAGKLPENVLNRSEMKHTQNPEIDGYDRDRSLRLEKTKKKRNNDNWN